MRFKPFLLAIGPALPLTLQGCESPPAVRQAPQVAYTRVFSDDDKRVARALSIGSEVQSNNLTPQYEAALCSLALAAIRDALRNSQSFSAQQLEAFDRAGLVFRRRAQAGLSAEKGEKIRSEVAAAYPEQGERARVAMGCLRKLA